MPGLIIWKNREMGRLKRDMDRLLTRFFDDFAVPFFVRPSKEGPFIDLSETKDRLILRAEIPGLTPEDLDISISGDILTVKGEGKQDSVNEEEGYRSTEMNYGYFFRTIQLPCKVQIHEVKATYKDGLLIIDMPKCEPELSREIKIKIR
ncbi:MAG: Hsp20/alpha crystallin family protein [Deltaproteobacteria bacterium]|nr:Hsp20/alpha crystallin family protein [Deltaproteobacteria bacterium]